jgi:16S rRNA processing protein RimM
MKSNRLKEIGVIIKPHSYRGAVVIRLHHANSEDFEQAKSLFLLIEGRAVPFMVATIDAIRTDSLVVSFSGYENSDKMAEFIGATVLVSRADDNEDILPDHNILIGFSLFDESGRFRGTILSVSERKHQWLATIEKEAGKTFLLPIHEDLIREFDEDQRKIVISVPEGIEDIG